MPENQQTVWGMIKEYLADSYGNSFTNLHQRGKWEYAFLAGIFPLGVIFATGFEIAILSDLNKKVSVDPNYTNSCMIKETDRDKNSYKEFVLECYTKDNQKIEVGLTHSKLERIAGEEK